MKQQINEVKRFQKLAGLINENEQSSVEEQVFDVLASNMNPELNTFIQPVEFMLDQAFAENVNIDTILEEVKQEMDFQLERANNNKDLRLVFAKVEAILSNGGIEEGIGKALGTAALGAALLGSPKQGMAQKRPSTTQNIKQQSNEELVDTVVTAYLKNPVAAKEWSKKFKKQHLVLGTIVDAIERVTDRSQDIDSTTVEKFGNYLKRYPRTTQEFLDVMKP